MTLRETLLRLGRAANGVTYRQAREAVEADHTDTSIRSTFTQLCRIGLMQRSGSHGSRRFTTIQGAKPIPIPRKKPPTTVAARFEVSQRAQAKRLTNREFNAAEAIVPAAVRVTVCPPAPEFDPRFKVDPATFKGGEFTAQWRRLRRSG